ncbi:inositol monophosphatase family protein [Sinomonas sp. ASV322]|uniref:inositol monophosphatase family protein n=1 Tax=Sinomonas sp. ASV322 TaxID=3041920 RepID=UPI0027DC0415|nr:inositol monophosphatase family protein [Sinomonas sp. ASV322]MDQ4503153.1 inositol monophosphatase family protein [Sinomonas sp. ASV322]
MTEDLALDPALDDATLAAALVRNAGGLALRMRTEGLSAERKTSVSDIVTAADKAAEAYVVDQLARCRPDDGVFGEEGASVPSASGRTWVIDPVDGTYNFFSGSRYWCSAIALRGEADTSDADPAVELGAIFQPQEDKLWVGGAAAGATLNGEPLVGPEDLKLALLGTATSIQPKWLEQPLSAMPWHNAAIKAASIRILGSGSCDLARVAEGEIGAWFQHSCPQWDWLPGKAIVQGAGGATGTVVINGLTWFAAGGATAVGEILEALAEVQFA